MELQDVHQQSDGNQRPEEKDTSCYTRKRYLVSFLTYFGCVSLNIMHIMNLNGFMDNSYVFENDSSTSKVVQLISLLVNTCGLLIAPLGAVGVRKFGGAVTFGAGVGFTALLTCSTPTLLYWHYSALWISQTLEGMLQGVCMCAVLDVLRLWSIPAERGRLIGLATSGFLIGGLMSFSGKRALTSENWRIPFYVTGILPLLWCLIWFIIVKNSPAEDKWITTQEKNYMKQSNATNDREVNYSCCSIFKSKPVWAYYIERFVLSLSRFSYYMYFHAYIERKIYSDYGDLYGDIETLSFSGYFCYPIGVIGASILADYLKNTNKWSISNVYKFYLSFGQIVVTSLFTLSIFDIFWKSSGLYLLSFVFQLILVISSVGCSVLPVDMGGQYATLIAGFGIVASTLGEIVFLFAVIFSSLILDSYKNDYGTITLFMGLVNMLGALIFFKYGSGDLQPWAVSSSSS